MSAKILWTVWLSRLRKSEHVFSGKNAQRNAERLAKRLGGRVVREVVRDNPLTTR